MTLSCAKTKFREETDTWAGNTHTYHSSSRKCSKGNTYRFVFFLSVEFYK